ncbi:MAG: CpsD/CapB family tyrosine-protein kinase [Acidobacteriota bacterium]
MGKVYEAIERAEREETKHNLSAVPFQNPHIAAKAEARETANQFDFIDYSLNAKPASEVSQRLHEEAIATFSRRSMIEPATQVKIDSTRIDPHLAAFFDSSLMASEQYNKLAISLIAEKEERPLKKILIASTHRAEGRTCVALNLACVLARARQKVLVIDADLQRPSVLRCLGIEAQEGLTNVIQQNLSPGQATIQVQPFGFQILPTREQVENPTELFTSPRFREVLEMLEPEFDFMLFDSSPLLRVNDANLLVRMTDVIVYVIRAGKTSSLQLGKAVRALTPEHIFGVVLNRTQSWAEEL